MKKHVFLSKSHDVILDSLIRYFPLNDQFNLYSISQEVKVEYKDAMDDGLSNNKQIYIDISDHLIYNGFAKSSSMMNDLILTDKGRELANIGSYRKFSKLQELRIDSEFRDLWTKKYWFWLEFAKIATSIFAGIIISYIVWKYFK